MYKCIAGEYYLISEFGERWFEPKGLILRPDFIADAYKTSLILERDLKVKLKLEFLTDIKKILEDENLHNLSGYLMFDIGLECLRPGRNMQIHAVLLSSHMFKIIELVGDEDGIERAEKQLRRIILAIKEHINGVVPVKGAIVLPRKIRTPSSIMGSDCSILYRDELINLLTEFSQASGLSNKVTEDNKASLAKMLHISFFEQCHPESKQEATCRAGQRLFLQRPEEIIKRFSQIDFNSVQLTNTQNCIKEDLMAGSAIVWGGYGIGKSIAIVAAVKESIEQYQLYLTDSKNERKRLKILFVSAQGLLSDVDLKVSPFLLMIEKWIKEACLDLGCDDELLLLNYTQFIDRNVNFVMQTKFRNKKDFIFCSYLLKTADLEILRENPWPLNKFDIVVFEETHALEVDLIKNVIKGFEKATSANKINSKIWITSNTERPDTILPSLKVTPGTQTKPENLRNLPAIVKLAEAINTNIGPERYPSTALLMSSVMSEIDVTYEYEWNDEKRCHNIVEEAKKWKQWLPQSSLLFIDCERSGLYEELKAEGIPIKNYGDQYRSGEPLFLRHSDPIEGIVAGSEWHLLIVHIKTRTLNSMEVIKSFNKRVISRITTKVYIFSDRLEITEFEEDCSDDIESTAGSTVKTTSVDAVNSSEIRGTDKRESSFTTEKSSLTSTVSRNRSFLANKVKKNESLMTATPIHSSGDFRNLIEHIKLLHNMGTYSDQKILHHEGYYFTHIRHLDVALRNGNEDIYLVHGRGEAFLVQLNANTEDGVKEAQGNFERLWGIRLSAYCGCTLVSRRHNNNVTLIARLLYLLQPKFSSSKINNTGFVSVSAEEADYFAKQGKNKLNL